jgi:ParB/RepB/Spo0J family partition protein
LTEFIQISQIDPSPFEPRSSITPIETADVGIVSPIIVRKKADGRYEIIAGHRRLETLKRAGKTEAPCEVVEMDDEQAAVALYNDNEAVKTWEGYEKGKYFQKMMQIFHLNQTQVAKKCGVSQELVSRCIGQVAFTDSIAQVLQKQAGSTTRVITRVIKEPNMELLKHAVSEHKYVELKKLSRERQVDAVKEILENNLSDRDTTNLVSLAKKAPVAKAAREVVKAKLSRRQEHYALKKNGKTEFRVRCSACAETHVYIMTHEPGGRHSIVEKDSAFHSQSQTKWRGATT